MQWTSKGATVSASLLGLCVIACGQVAPVGEGTGGSGASSGGTSPTSGGAHASGGTIVTNTGGGGGVRPSGGAAASGGVSSTGGTPGSGGAAVTPCTRPEDCRRPYTCRGTKTFSCTAADCARDTDCESGFQCYRGACEELRGLWGSCGAERKCSPELECHFEYCTMKLGPSAPCDARCEDADRDCFTDARARPFCIVPTVACQDGTICQWDEFCSEGASSGSFWCVKRRAPAEPCTTDRMCALGAYCQAGSCEWDNGGRGCTVDADCPEGNYCGTGTLDTFQCVPRHLPFAPCSGRCVDGFRCSGETRLCEPFDPPACNGACADGMKCEGRIENGFCSPPRL